MGRAFLRGLVFGVAAGTAVGGIIILVQALGGILPDGPYRNDLEAP